MADIFREVDEEVRRAHYAKLWNKYGRLVIGAAVALVLAVGGVKAWQAWDLQQREDRSDRFAAALVAEQSDGLDAAYQAFAELADPSEGGYGLLAAMQQARILVEQDDVAGAVALWDQVASNSAAGAAYQGAASILSVLHQIDSGVEPGQLERRLEPLLVAGSPYRPLAMELYAAIALAAGDKETARIRYGELGEDAGAPNHLRARARQVLDALAE